MYSRIFESRFEGGTVVSLAGSVSDIFAVSEPDCRRAVVKVFTEADSGPSIKIIDGLVAGGSHGMEIEIPTTEIVRRFGRGGIVLGSGNVVQIGNGGVQINTFRGRASSGESVFQFDGNTFKVRNGRTYVNGRDVTDEAPALEGAVTPIHFEVTLPPGSLLFANTQTGTVTTRQIDEVKITTQTGDVDALVLSVDSQIDTQTGAVRVSSRTGAKPRVVVRTQSGDITVLDDNVRLRPSTLSGRIRYPR